MIPIGTGVLSKSTESGSGEHCWICECGQQGRWTSNESVAIRGMHLHRNHHRKAKEA